MTLIKKHLCDKIKSTKKVLFLWLKKAKNKIELNKNKYKISTMCSVLNIMRQNYYKYKNTVDKDYDDYLVIKSILEEGKELYVTRRLKKSILNETGWIINLKKIRRIMKKI